MGTLAVAISAIGFGLSPYLATRAFDAGVSPESASFVRIALLMVVLSPFAPQMRGWRREAYIVAAGGAVSMLGFAGFFVALDRAPIAAATVVYYTYPVVVLVLSSLVWKRSLHLWEGQVCAAALFGVLLSVGPIGMSSETLIALAPAFAAPIGWAIYLLVLSGPAAAMPTLPKVFAGSCGGTVALLPLAIWRTGGQMMPLTSSAIIAVGLLTLFTLAIPALLVTWGAPHAGDRATAMIGSVEFVVALGVGWLLMGNDVGLAQLVGITLVVAAAIAAARRQVPTETSPSSDFRSGLQPRTSIGSCHPTDQAGPWNEVAFVQRGVSPRKRATHERDTASESETATA